ncbi:hypothetical protein HMPREF0973_00312 [Prevotella veroralis F0319]|uniref:Uncharacterized protein n=1 Tax=Prevotella veroralis F0319 TaxID=649761 RepID=C9ML37_9BACT|nr:hypothetical protein HMPREF0973_00312 [Prevotella veroralis F0319]
MQGTLADAESATYGFVVEPFVLFGRIADELFDTMDKVCKVGAVLLPCLAVDNNEFHFLDFVLITLLLLGKRTNMQSIAVLIECKSKPSEAPLQEMRKSREIEGREKKLVCQFEKLLSFHPKAPKLSLKSS